jgi:uncharacterized membrane protein YciS (DUF1049 family)
MDKKGHELLSGLVAFVIIVGIIAALVALSMNFFRTLSTVNVQGQVNRITVDSVSPNGTVMHEVFVNPATTDVQQIVVKGT